MSRNQYQQVNVMTASPMQLVIMLYDECIRTLERAKQLFPIDEPSKIEALNNSLLHAQDVITELAVSLNMEQGGDVAASLQRLYDFMVNHLSEANVKKDKKRVADVCKMMIELRESWQEVMTKEEPQEQRVSPVQATGTIRVSG
jgi:flagellar protein FliS